ncbi:MAG TPA: zinc-binding alcohol dehydrogenase family protein [Candidatus Hydrogenedentes bacterium]|jgi:NADPH2:quinone reductase|nr:zinc-binding alcohol dehydrogenase family protein [Candidatus Hydrogenedentota bacterium]MDY0031073.1 zinc-binding alcohol dehydrogenase family protein [FCB group bacterium]NLT60682.1 zinc-binding alcohol dehydrogenase family protein [Candidatus Hydrogenedentota bacterium]HNV20466.1 zinc-binding alcohol dehydrogenase family protein [Candidatus Hydrogenedentota bacterium]HNZ18680.1 zinc-binding alcohol dehydrogenase family protein [Candidatus Hydrogenedentota bacterium]
MKSWRFHQFGDIGNLRMDDIPIPKPAPNEALVKLHYAALNPADAYLVKGQYPRPGTPPFAVGRDGCGVVEKPGDSGRFRAGDTVVVLRSEIGVTREGTLAEYVAAPEASLAPLPAGWKEEEGAAAPLVFLTAWQALVDAAALEPGQTVLVTGASGGVGTASVLLAKILGAKVVALSRSAEKRARLKTLGADIAVDAEIDGLEMRVKEALGGGRVDAVVENLAGPYLQASINLCRERGRIALVGLLAGTKAQMIVGTLLFKRVRVEGVAVGAYTPGEAQEAWRQIVTRLDAAGARPPIDIVFPLESVPEAFAHLERGPFGKVLVRTGA